VRRFVLRWGAAFIGVCCGWVFDLVLILCFSNESVGSSAVTGFYFFAAWILAGLPLAVWGPRFSSPARILVGCAICGWIGVLMVALTIAHDGFLRRLGLLGVLRLLLIPWIGWWLSFPAAAISMLVYILIVRVLPAASAAAKREP
jgi:hypothetical protein